MTTSNRAKVCALIAALQWESAAVGRLQILSGFDEQAVRNWLAEFERAKLVTESEREPPAAYGRGSSPRLWAWRFA